MGRVGSTRQAAGGTSCEEGVAGDVTLGTMALYMELGSRRALQCLLCTMVVVGGAQQRRG